MNGFGSLSQLTCPVEIIGALLEILTEKEREVIRRRFGLNGKEAETLARVGQDFGVTRERVRQIQSYALKKMSRNSKNTNLNELHDWLREALRENGEIISERTLSIELKNIYPEQSNKLAELKLACILDEGVIWEHNKVDFVPHFRLTTISFATIKNASSLAIKSLKKAGEVIDTKELIATVQKEFREKDLNLRNETVRSSLVLDRRITINEKGASLTEWRHINPRTLFDKIMYVLNEAKEPTHFKEIAQMISDENFDPRPVSVQAVHNELINNPVFILIGRGIYALKNWGYKEGTVSEVIKGILEKNGPMHLHDLTKEVLQRRKVKPVTVQINLNSKKEQFKKNTEGKYELL